MCWLLIMQKINRMANLRRTQFGKVDLDYVLGVGGFDLERWYSSSHLCILCEYKFFRVLISFLTIVCSNKLIVDTPYMDLFHLLYFNSSTTAYVYCGLVNWLKHTQCQLSWIWRIWVGRKSKWIEKNTSYGWSLETISGPQSFGI